MKAVTTALVSFNTGGIGCTNSWNPRRLIRSVSSDKYKSTADDMASWSEAYCSSSARDTGTQNVTTIYAHCRPHGLLERGVLQQQ